MTHPTTTIQPEKNITINIVFCIPDGRALRKKYFKDCLYLNGQFSRGGHYNGWCRCATRRFLNNYGPAPPLEYDVEIFYCVFIVLTRVTSEDRCAPTSGFQPWSHRLIPNINLQQKRSLREPVFHTHNMGF